MTCSFHFCRKLVCLSQESNLCSWSTALCWGYLCGYNFVWGYFRGYESAGEKLPVLLNAVQLCVKHASTVQLYRWASLLSCIMSSTIFCWEHFRAKYSICWVLQTPHFLRTAANISSSRQLRNTKSYRVKVHSILCSHASFEVEWGAPSHCKLWSTWKIDEIWTSATFAKSLAPYIPSWS